MRYQGSVASRTDEARALRLQRLEEMLTGELTDAAMALETLLAELAIGERRRDDWTLLHFAAARDGRENELAAAYEKTLARDRMRVFTAVEQTRILLHAADFLQTMVSDSKLAWGFLRRVLEILPNHAESFERLERGLKASGEPRDLLELYALVARAPAIARETLATRVLDLLDHLPATSPLSDDACQRLMALVPTNTQILDAVDAHYRKTGRSALGIALRQEVLERDLPDQALRDIQRGLRARYL